jgi:phage terminase small subunit
MQNAKASNLTAKQESFAKAVALGEPQTDAYRQAYDADGMGAPTIWAEASRLTSHPKVAARIEQLRSEKEDLRRMLVLDREESILMQLQHEALTAKTDSARIRALELLGRHVGLFAERVELARVDRTAEQIQADIIARLRRLGVGGA